MIKNKAVDDEGEEVHQCYNERKYIDAMRGSTSML